jgi:predicted DNA-binding antitoxin AbrB/MazE fold protein
MTRHFEAVFTNGVLRPDEPLPLREQQRVRVTVETEEPGNGDRAAAIARFRAGALASGFHSDGPYPRREDLHERGS